MQSYTDLPPPAKKPMGALEGERRGCHVEMFVEIVAISSNLCHA